MADNITNIFAHTKTPKKLSQFTLSRGVADFSNMAQWNRYEKGYYFLTVIDIPNFLKKLGQINGDIGEMISEYVHVLEYEFRGISGLEDISSETGEITDGISTINMINKVTMQSASTFSMTYTERSGGLLTKVNEIFLRGVKDPRTQIKRYGGLITPDGNGEMSSEDAGFEQEVFKFLYFTTDNTALNIERAFYIVSAQPTKAELSSLYQGDKGNYEFPELSMEFSGYPITGPRVDLAAKKILYAIQSDAAGSSKLQVDSNNFDYSALGINRDSANESTGTADAKLTDYADLTTSGTAGATDKSYTSAQARFSLASNSSSS